VIIKGPVGLMWFIHLRLLMLLGQELTKFLPENKKSWLEK
jgi:hypothetical protein